MDFAAEASVYYVNQPYDTTYYLLWHGVIHTQCKVRNAIGGSTHFAALGCGSLKIVSAISWSPINIAFRHIWTPSLAHTTRHRNPKNNATQMPRG